MSQEFDEAYLRAQQILHSSRTRGISVSYKLHVAQMIELAIFPQDFLSRDTVYYNVLTASQAMQTASSRRLILNLLKKNDSQL